MSRPPASTRDGEIYEVFACFKSDEALHHIGSVVAPDPELASVYAQKLYDEWTWSEMILVARQKIVMIKEAV